MKIMRKSVVWLAMVLFLSGAVIAGATEMIMVSSPAAPFTPAAPMTMEVGLGRRVLWYVPNRFMDLFDMFRFRVRVGPGLAAGLRVTDYAAFYAGNYASVYAGLPGPRNSRYVRWPVGYECLKGVVIGGVNATDDTLYGPGYGRNEIDLGVHLGVVGGEVGFDPLEFADFLTGLFMFDLVRDDYPRPKGPGPGLTSGVTRGTTQGMFRQSEKPAVFEHFTERLDYLHTNIHQRVSQPIRSMDEFFALDELSREAVPDSRLRLGVYVASVRGETREVTLEPETDLDVSLPNMENRLHVFAQSGSANDLPGRPPSESTGDKGLDVGVRRLMKQSAISADVGVRVKLHPKAFVRVTWHPRFEFDQWSVRPQQRFFLDSNDRLGSRTSLFVDRWLGDSREYYAGSTSSGLYTQDSSEWAWEQTFRLG